MHARKTLAKFRISESKSARCASPVAVADAAKNQYRVGELTGFPCHRSDFPYNAAIRRSRPGAERTASPIAID
jgi:hypothetical protein